MQAFSITAAVRRVCADMINRLPELSHINISHLAIGVCRCRRDTVYGIYASMTPLRFAGGKKEKCVGGKVHTVPAYLSASGEDCLYLLNIYLPRFLNTPLEEKLSTILHELWHISPKFDGDLRRFSGRCYAHGNSKELYDASMDRLAQRWLAKNPPEHIYDFLDHDYNELTAKFGGIYGDKWPSPVISTEYGRRSDPIQVRSGVLAFRS